MRRWINMGNASRQSKQKQQTSKSASPALVREQDNAPATPETVRIDFSAPQAELIKQLLVAVQESQSQLQLALMAAGIDGRDVLGGDLDDPVPHLIVGNAGGVSEG
jgi:hypothetical protein